MIDEKELIEQIKSLRVTITGLRAEKSILNEYAQHFKDSVIRIIDEQPKVGEWISVEERLPNVYKTVLITTYNQEVRTAFLDGEHYWFSGLFTYTFDDVLAWKPLPEPYKGETE